MEARDGVSRFLLFSHGKRYAALSALMRSDTITTRGRDETITHVVLTFGMLATTALVLPSPAQTDVYKCVIDGTTAYQRTPCGESEPINTDTVTIMGGSRDDESSSLNPVIRLQPDPHGH